MAYKKDPFHSGSRAFADPHSFQRMKATGSPRGNFACEDIACS